MWGTASGLIAVIVFQSLTPSESRQCEKSPQTNYGCPFDRLSSSATWCEADSYNNLPFSFYIKPGNNFNELAIAMTKTILGVTGRVGRFQVKKNWLRQADKWYHIQLKNEKTGILGVNTAYHLLIDGYQKATITAVLTAAEKFNVVVNGSPFYRRDGCNPGNFPRPQPTNPPPSLTTVPPRHTLPRPVEVTKTPSPIPEETVESDIVTPKSHSHVTDNTENGSSEHSVMVDSSISDGSSNSSDSLLILGEPWWVFVIVGISFTIIIAVIITATVMIKNWKVNKEEKSPDIEENGVSNETFSDQDWQNMPSPPLNADEFDDPANHIYEEPQHFNNDENIYEEVDDLGGQIIYANVNVRQPTPSQVVLPERDNILNQSHNPWQSRRGSSHDSENSLYGYI